MMRPAFLLMAAVLCAPAAGAAQDADGCAKFKWSIGRERDAFAAPNLPVVEPGQRLPGVPGAVALKLSPQTGVVFTRPPGRPPRAAPPRVDPAFAAVVELPAVERAGTYQVTLSDDAWIDVIQNGREVRSAGFSGQTGCPGVRKSVRFPLQPGAATIQISGAPGDGIKLDIVPAE